MERFRPKLNVFAHPRGHRQAIFNGARLINATAVDKAHGVVHEPQVVEIEFSSPEV